MFFGSRRPSPPLSSSEERGLGSVSPVEWRRLRIPGHAEACPLRVLREELKPIRSKIFQFFASTGHERAFHHAKNLGR